MGIIVISTAFRKIHFGFGVGGMHFAHHAGFARVTVPSDGMCIPPKIGIIQFRYHPPPIHIVMIQDPYLGGRICLFEERPQVFDDEFGLAFLGPRTRGHLTMLVSINSF